VSTDGRIVFGRGLGAIGSGTRVHPAHWHDRGTVDTVTEDLRRWFPRFAAARITHTWGGPVDRTPGHLPFVGTLGDGGNIHYAVGYSGNGVAPSVFVGRILAALATGSRDEYATCALVGGPPAYLPPEPLRTAGGRLVKAAVQRVEHAEVAGAGSTTVSRLVKSLASAHTPNRLEPRLRRRTRRR
ncbi:MAG: NAD(P)/FAD-dependent oxidoreductase, partial [Sciscionella sp.]